MWTSRGRRWRVVPVSIVSAFVLAAGPAFAQTGGLRGKIVDPSGKPVGGVEILIETLDGVTHQVRCSSNDNGDFVQIGMRGGSYRLTFRKDGYEPLTQDFQVGMTQTADIGRVTLERVPEGELSRSEIEKTAEAVQRHFDEGAAAVEKRDYQSALVSFQQAAAIAPESAEAQFNMGYVYTQMNDRQGALVCYEKATEIQPDYYEAWVELGNLYNEEGKYQESLEAFERAVAIQPTKVPTLYNYGAVALNAGTIPRAKEAFERILEIQPDHALANFQMAVVLVNLAKNQDAIPYLEKYLALDPEGAHVTTARAMLDYLKQD